jgi:hypothetical protein
MSQLTKINDGISNSTKEFNMTSNDTIFGLENILQVNFDLESQSEDVDDFEELFDSLSIKIISSIFCFALLTFTNAFNILVSIFERYGGDPLKRSLKNQLISQLGYGMMMNNTIYTPILTWRYIL